MQRYKRHTIKMLNYKPIKKIMKRRYLKKLIASDNYNLLRDDESRIGYFLLRMRYKIELLLTKEK